MGDTNTKTNSHGYAVIMAGGSGTRLWPLSRKELPKQMQNFISEKTLINETVERLLTFVDKDNLYITTTSNYEKKIKGLLPMVSSDHIIIEPVARGTTAALALVTSVIHKRDPQAILFYVASDHAITGMDKFKKKFLETLNYVAQNPRDIALIGVKPTRPDTGLGYIKAKKRIQSAPDVYTVDKFVEKPSFKVARRYVESGQYYWNAAYYCFKAETLLEAYNDSDPEIGKNVDNYLASKNPKDFNKVPIKAQEIEVINASKYRLVVIPADFIWSDIGNWQSLHELLTTTSGTDLISHGGEHIDINSTNCLIYSTKNKLVATVGLDNIVIVETEDILLVMNKNQPQEIKKVLEDLKEKGLEKYL